MQALNFFDVDKRLCEIADKALLNCKEKFNEIDEIKAFNQAKVLSAFIKNGVSAAHLIGTSGYGYDDSGRDNLDRVFATAFKAEDCVVRHNFMSGTHTISTALFGLLRPGDKMLSVTGEVYDTLLSVIGKNYKKGDGSLRDFGIIYNEVPLLESGLYDLEAIKEACKENIKMAYIQRSRGYSLRPSFTEEQTEEIISAIRSVNKTAIIVVDNCYCEFVSKREPTEYGADIIIGSLIKNAGGGVARTGGYIAGKKDLVALCADRLAYVGTGKEIGCSLDMNRELYLGFFNAPQTSASAVKTAVFAAEFYSLLGFETTPKSTETRADIVQCLLLENSEKLISFCRGIQSGSPIDSFATPFPSYMPGYESKVIMAAGAFTMGASIELSADAPLREPYAVWLQGSLNFESSIIGIMLSAQNMLNEGLLAL